ncbi:MAG: Atu1372/SO_1960 family protein [Alphaproteobacteria bacterium]
MHFGIGEAERLEGVIITWPKGETQDLGRLAPNARYVVTQGSAVPAKVPARTCALSILAQAREALGGDLDRVVRCVKLSGFVASTPDFGDQPKVINGASDLMVEIFGDAGRHARAAVGMASLPLGVAVEVEAIFEVN